MEHLKQIKQNDIIRLTLYLVHFVILEGCHFATMWKTLAWQHLTMRGGLLLINLAYLVPSQKSERSCICYLFIYDFMKGFWYCMIFFYYYHIAINIFIVNIVVISTSFSLNLMELIFINEYYQSLHIYAYYIMISEIISSTKKLLAIPYQW